MQTHDPLHFASSLDAKLASRSRHVCILLGAGVARACGLPDLERLQSQVVASLDDDARRALESQLAGRDLEQALSRLRRIAALLEGESTLDDLTGVQADNLDKATCKAIVRELDSSRADLSPARNLAAWVRRANYRLPVEIFTLNYDLLMEMALEDLRVPYFDGFVGHINARFHTDLVEAVPGRDEGALPAYFARLWKLHGSVNWTWVDSRDIVRLGHSVKEGSAAAIYPADTKYEESRRVPFLVLQDRFRRALAEPETIVLVAGYSFRDDHVNELLFDAAFQRERSEIVVFCYDEIPAAVADRANRTPNLQVVGPEDAILGGLQGKWRAAEGQAGGIWSGDRFLLGDFGSLARHMAKSAAGSPTAEHVRDMKPDGHPTDPLPRASND